MRSYKRPEGARKALLKTGEFKENTRPRVREVHAACAFCGRGVHQPLRVLRGPSRKKGVIYAFSFFHDGGCGLSAHEFR